MLPCFFAAALLLRLWLVDKYNNSIVKAFRLALVDTFLSLLAAPAYHTLLGLGKARYSLVAATIISGDNFVLVLLGVLLLGHISVNRIFVGLIFYVWSRDGFLTSKVYKVLNRVLAYSVLAGPRIAI